MSNTEDKTLCALQEEGYIESHTEDFKKLIQPARFFLSKLWAECSQIRKSLQSEGSELIPRLKKSRIDMSLYPGFLHSSDRNIIPIGIILRSKIKGRIGYGVQ